MNNKGFILTETLIVSAVVLTTLVLIYSQFARINSNYTDALYYNTVSDIYSLNQVSNYLGKINQLENLYNNLNMYIDITDCNNSIYPNKSYCTSLMKATNIKTLLFTYNSKIAIVGELSKNNPYTLNLQNFIKTIDDSDENYTARLIAEFKDGTYGSVPIKKNPIGNLVLEAFPELALGTSGCKTPSTKNYSYMNGCYLKGAQAKNYIWYSGFLWRIMGINADGTIRLITEENVTAIPYNVSGNINFEGSHVDSWLNNYFYNNLRGSNIIVSNNFCQGAATTTATSRTDCTGGTTLNKKVGLISLDEYNLAGGTSSSYLENTQWFWTTTPYDSKKLWTAHYMSSDVNNDTSNAFGVRAVINVNSNSAITGGNGTIGSTWTNDSSPYVLNDNKNVIVTGLLKDKANAGEYIKFANKIYRVVSVDKQGNSKLILDSYYQETAGTNHTMIYGNDNAFTITSGIGQKLNVDVLNWLIPLTDVTNRNKLVTNYTWYQNNFSLGDSYSVSLNETTPTRSIEATVGLIRIGEMLSSQSYTILTKNGTVASNYNNTTPYWTMQSNANSLLAWSIGNYGDSYIWVLTNTYALRPVIVVKSDTKITGGTGTPSSPYEI